MMNSAMQTKGINKVQPTVQPDHRRLRVGLWVAQVLLAVMFGMAGYMKTTQPIAQLAQMLPVTEMPEALIRFIGVSELAGALGLILPAATRLLPALTPAAAGGLTVVMILAAGFHISRGEFSHLPIVLVLGSLTAFIAWGRTTRAKISQR